MNIYNIKEGAMNETTGISLNIYLSGCKGYCPGCHSDHTWDFTAGSKLEVQDLINYISDLKSFTFDHLCVLGGEPLDNPITEVVELLSSLKSSFPDKPLWLYTHFELEKVDKKVISILDYIKTGMFIPNIPEAKEQFGVFLSGDNQIIHKLK